MGWGGKKWEGKGGESAVFSSLKTTFVPPWPTAAAAMSPAATPCVDPRLAREIVAAVLALVRFIVSDLRHTTRSVRLLVSRL